MNYSVETLPHFKKRAKKLIKKFPSLRDELRELGIILSTTPTYGTKITEDVYKIRLAIKSKGKGKSGGARIITHVYVAQNTVYLLDIYDKSDQQDITDKEIRELLSNIE